jgi:hypothetical protein
MWLTTFAMLCVVVGDQGAAGALKIPLVPPYVRAIELQPGELLHSYSYEIKIRKYEYADATVVLKIQRA